MADGTSIEWPMGEPRVLTSESHREMARRKRDRHWAFADRVLKHGTVWVRWWGKKPRHQSNEPLPDDLEVLGLISGLELLGWLNSHKDWWEIGEWCDERYAAPVCLTDEGRQALQNREQYDMEPVVGGLVEPGWQCIPAEVAG